MGANLLPLTAKNPDDRIELTQKLLCSWEADDGLFQDHKNYLYSVYLIEQPAVNVCMLYAKDAYIGDKVISHILIK